MRAAQGSDPEVVSLLLENGAGGKNIFAENKKGKNVIDIAEQWSDLESYKMLKDHFDKVPKPKVSFPIQNQTVFMYVLRKNEVVPKRKNRKKNRLLNRLSNLQLMLQHRSQMLSLPHCPEKMR